MKYLKPEIALLGDACDLIEECGKDTCINDGSDLSDDPAYDLDE